MTYDDITQKEKRISGALALVLHVLFFVLLMFGVSWQQKRPDATMVVDLWNNLPPVQQPKVEAAPAPEVKPPPEPPKPVPKVEPKPEPVPKPDISLKEKLEKERKQKEQQKLDEERKRKEQEKLEAKKREDQKKREQKLAALKQKQEKEAEAKRIAQEQEEALKKIQQQAEQAAAQDKLMEAYMNGVREKIKRFVVIPPNLQGNPEAQFDVVQIPGGEVLSVKLKRSSGNAAYDSAVERAILKAQPLPPPPAGVAFGNVRELILKFRPKD